MIPNILTEKPQRKNKLNKEAPSGIFIIANKLANKACPTPNPPGEIGIATVIKPIGIKVKTYGRGKWPI